jgi:hypothetical protein
MEKGKDGGKNQFAEGDFSLRIFALIFSFLGHGRRNHDPGYGGTKVRD